MEKNLMENVSKKSQTELEQSAQEKLTQLRVKSKFWEDCYDESPKRFIFNMVIVGINEGFTFERVKKDFVKLDWNTLFGSPGARSWLKLLEIYWTKLEQNKKYQGKAVLLLRMEKAVKRAIPESALVMEKQKQKLQYSELAFILKTITAKILKLAKESEYELDYCKLARKYFLVETFKKSYQEKTERRINKEKIARIVALLHEYGLIRMTHRRDSATRYRRNMYHLTPLNPYWGRLNNVPATEEE